jgi:hypothetical protein
MGEQRLFRESLYAVWKGIQDQIKRYSEVLSRKLQSKGFTRTQTVVAITPAGPVDVYNMHVEDTNCFAVNGGLIVHNCYDADRYALMSFPVKPQRFKSKKPINHIERYTKVRSIWER